MSLFERMKEGLTRSRERLTESLNVILRNGPDVNEDFWDELEETLILSDMGAVASAEIVEEIRDMATRKALADGESVKEALIDKIAAMFPPALAADLGQRPACVVFVGVNGSGKTTTTGKLAARAKAEGASVVLGAADTFRAAAIEQLEEWARRSNVPIVARKRGSDPASVCFETLQVAREQGADYVLIDTAGRLHTSDDLMRELCKVVGVVRKQAECPVITVLVLDATTGQNGLQQAKVFNKSLDLDGVIMTKLDGTAKGGIAVAVAHELGLPILKVGIGEGIEDLRDFDAHDFARALVD